MERSSSQQQPHQAPQRETVFCHECENEWYRDEHGLTCPECQSDFTEIIEPEHDPRAELLMDDDESPGLVGLHHHNPWTDPHPQQEPVETVHIVRNGPGGLTINATFHRTILPRSGDRTVGPADESLFNPLLQNFATMLQGIIGPNPPRPPGAPPLGSNQPESQAGAPEVPPHQQHGHRFQYSPNARLFPRDANHPQPHLEPLDDLNSVIGTLFSAFPPGLAQANPQRQQGNGPPPPFHDLAALFASMLDPQAARHGDFVYTQEALDRIITQLMEQNATGNAPGPASEESIAALGKREITIEDLGSEGKVECSICMDEVNIGEEVTVLPCAHWFHGNCISVWLREHDTCPHCRKGIEDPSKQNDAAPSNDARSPTQTTPTWPGSTVSYGTHDPSNGDGTRSNPFMLPDSSPPSTPSSSNRRNGSGRDDGSGGRSSGGGIRGFRNLFGGHHR